nr:MAG TPA: hypothetical protein [Caudoviricetes sp.]
MFFVRKCRRAPDLLCSSCVFDTPAPCIYSGPLALTPARHGEYKESAAPLPCGRSLCLRIFGSYRSFTLSG